MSCWYNPSRINSAAWFRIFADTVSSSCSGVFSFSVSFTCLRVAFSNSLTLGRILCTCSTNCDGLMHPVSSHPDSVDCIFQQIVVFIFRFIFIIFLVLHTVHSFESLIISLVLALCSNQSIILMKQTLLEIPARFLLQFAVLESQQHKS